MSHWGALLTNGPFAVFLAVFLGVLLGQLDYRGFSLGVSATLFVGLALGYLGFRVEHAYFTLSLVLFIAAVGLLASEEIGGVVRTHGVNFAGFGEEGEDLVRAAYADNYDRLAEVKQQYDPTNLFRHNRNVEPGGQAD